MANSIHCPGCGDNITYNIDKRGLFCKSCGRLCEPEEIPFDPNDIKKDVDEITCNNCGGILFKEKFRITTNCPFCGASSLSITESDGLSRELLPKYIIPFRVNREEAVKNFKEFYKGTPFLPKDFDSEVTLEKMTALYAPFWLMDVEAGISANGDYFRNEFEKFFHKNNPHFFNEESSALFTLIPLDASVVIEDRVAEAIEPYNYDDLRPFHPGYISGFYANRYRLTPEDLEGRLINRAEDYLVESVKEKVGNPLHIDFHRKDFWANPTDRDYAMFPIWFLYYNYKGKKYDFMVNGQTGEVAGDLPAVKWQRLLTKASIYTASIALLLLTLFIISAIFTGFATLDASRLSAKTALAVTSVEMIYSTSYFGLPLLATYTAIAYRIEQKLTRIRGVEPKPKFIEYWRKAISEDELYKR